MASIDMKHRHWWELPKNEAHTGVLSNFQFLSNNDKRNRSYLTYTSLYTNREVSNESVHTYINERYNASQRDYSRVPLNVIKTMVDQVHSRVGKMRPRPRFLTDGGNYSLQRRAKLLQRWTDTQFHTGNIYEQAAETFRDACIFGIGAAKTYRIGEKIKVERVYPGELFVDELEAFYGNVRQLYQRKYVSKAVLVKMFPQHKEKIERAGQVSVENDDVLSYHHQPERLSEHVRVIESWYLPSLPGSKDGRHVLAIQGVTLFDEVWEQDEFPFSFVRWSREPRGFYGIGLAEELLGLHIDVNITINRIKEAFELVASPIIFREQGSGVKAAHLTNVPGTIIDYVGTKPSIETPQAVHPEMFNHLNNQLVQARQISRLGEAAFGQGIPAGLETGAAVREWNDVQSQGFVLVSQAYEDFFMSLTKHMVRLGKDIYKENNNYTVVSAKDRYTISKIKWSEVDIDEDAYVLKVFPASSLPLHPAGRSAKVLDFMAAGLIDPAEAKELMDFPDFDEHMSLDRATSANIDRMIEEMLDNGKPMAVEPFMDMQLALKKTQAAYNKAQMDGVPENRLALLRRFMTSITAKLQQAQQELMEQQMALMAGPPAAPPGPDATGAVPTAVTGAEPV